MKNILVPTDFSKTAQVSTEYAAHLAKSLNAKITLYHAFHVPAPVTGVPAIVVSPEEMEAENMERLQAIASDLNTKLGTHINIECKSKIGFAVESITEESKSSDYSLIVMGIDGSSAIAEVLIGSSTTAVMRYSKIPLLAVPAGSTYKDINHITFAWDLHDISHPENLNALFDIGRAHKSSMDIVHIVEKGKKDDVDVQKETEHIKQFAKDYDFTFSVNESEDVVDGLNECVDKFGSDLIALIPQKHSFFERLINEPSSKKMAFHTHVPLLTIPN
ncbi:MAG: universal stress protein [Bacteroidia bacterium]|nr:universal stress protein [Bacteroidia bacterium]NNM15822.1 universal stress protein [Bacteroidia bacterium]